MAREIKYGIDNRLVFREIFNSESEVRINGGVPTNVEFSIGCLEDTFNQFKQKQFYSI